MTSSTRNCLENTCLDQVGSFIVRSYLVSSEIQGICYVLGVDIHDTSGITQLFHVIDVAL